MRIAVFGASGQLGQEVVKQALAAGHEVVAMVRDPNKMVVKHDNLQVEKVNIFDETTLSGPLSDCEAVISCLGVRPSYRTPTTVYSESIKPIVEAMKHVEVRKLVVASSWYTVGDSRQPFFVRFIVRPLFLGRTLQDMARMENVLTQTYDLDYTVVRLPSLTNKPMIDGEITSKEDNFVPSAPSVMPRENAAQYMLSLATSDNWKRKMVAIATSKADKK